MVKFRGGSRGGHSKRIYNPFLLQIPPPPTPLPHTFGCQVTAGNSYPLCSPVLLTFPCEVCLLCANGRRGSALRSRGGEGKGRQMRGQVQGNVYAPVLSTPTTTSSSKPTVLLYSSELLFIRAINSLSQSFLKCISSSVPFHKHLSRAWLALSSASFLPHIPIRLEPQPNWMSLPPVLFPPYALRCCSSAAKIQRGLILHTQ